MNFSTSRPLAAIGRFLITMLVLALATYAGWLLWLHYEVEPWTRDGRVKANVVQVAPDVSGLVMNVAVHDNQDVKAGDLLFEIDRARYQLAFDQAQAVVQADTAARDQAQRDVKRNRSLGKLVAAEMVEQSRLRLHQAQAALAQAKVQLASAQLNLSRSRVYAITDGRVTNLSLRAGDYVTVGKPVLALIDSASFYVEGYFEEGKLGNIHINDPATVTLMGSSAIIRGHVQSIALGIADRERSIGSDLLPNVNPTFNWIRLAQRVPVRISIDGKEAGMLLVAGQTATVNIAPAGQGD
ncbi:MAG TPA: HlyD family secretion protein [Advenella sp.]|nr:HlyD family secretion protein [Advenella sp.]